MGNQNSRSQTPTSSPQSPTNATAAHHSQYPSARRRESIQTLSTVKAQAIPPSASLEHAESHPTSIRPHSRGRGQTVASTATSVASQLRAAQESFNNTMGNEQSSHKGPKEKPPPTRPVDVPAAPREEARTEQPPTATAIDAAADADAAQDYLVPSSSFSRPPRLPLPIEEEVYTPGSPIIAPHEDESSPIDHDVEGALPRRSSMLSTTTADDEDLGDEFKQPTTGRPTVPTLIEWEGPGERVYVTGTFAGWNRKYRLHPNGPSKKKDALSAWVLITPGTHHLMFIVDNDMRTSDKLPTAVDYTNILVNYVEVPYNHVQPLKPLPADAKEAFDTVTPVQEHDAPAGMHPPQILQPAPELKPTLKAPLPEPPKPVVPEPSKKYHQNIPRYLIDLDAPENSSRFARANAMTNNLPTPPSLPGFLGKSILNGTTPMKDDSSVLIHPNHTVLNHLATSSIKDNILATSATTRYKQKFLTTIMYKPKEEGGVVY
ncbi:AMPKBI-domain-containing protein [Clathrospora elynae]|uniref:AMPKBI-domain-containing protein n=1 Tax=Clathrospora elynae TaxID=706981 RepID=A0A6A5T2E1_9PLEO|nr:AMPKBI-domain-containing protein [Clathrospora elynae]